MRRDYRDDAGNKLPGVTTIIGATWAKPALMHWAWKEGQAGRDYRDKHAADVGSCAHAMIEAELRGERFDSSEWTSTILDSARWAFTEFDSWRSTVHITPVAIEKPLISREFRCGATLDCVAWLNGGEDLAYLDWKTSAGTFADMIVQGAAYRSIWNETQPRPIRSVHIVRFPKDGARFEHHRVPEYEDWEITNAKGYTNKMPSLERGLRIFRMLRELYDERAAIGEV